MREADPDAALRKRTASRCSRKQCERCGQVGWYKPMERRCKYHRFGPRSYWCYGKVVAVTVRRRAAETEATGDAVDAAELGRIRGELWRRRAGQQAARVRKRLEDAEDRVCTAQRELRRAETVATKWARKVAALERRAAMTDAAVAERYDHLNRGRQIQQVRRRLVAAAGGGE